METSLTLAHKSQTCTSSVLIDTVKKVIDALSVIDINDDQILKQTLLDTISAIDSPLVTRQS